MNKVINIVNIIFIVKKMITKIMKEMSYTKYFLYCAQIIIAMSPQTYVGFECILK